MSAAPILAEKLQYHDHPLYQHFGKPTGEVDAMIAAVAVAHKAEPVTGTIRHFLLCRRTDWAIMLDCKT